MMAIVTVERGSDELLERVGSAGPFGEGGASFEALYRQRYRDVYRYALLMLRSAEDAEDVTGEAFQRAYAAWDAGHGPSGEALPWLLLITRRLVIDRARRRKLLSWLPLGGLRSSHEPMDQTDTGRTEFWLWFERFAQELPAQPPVPHRWLHGHGEQLGFTRGHLQDATRDEHIGVEQRASGKGNSQNQKVLDPLLGPHGPKQSNGHRLFRSHDRQRGSRHSHVQSARSILRL